MSKKSTFIHPDKTNSGTIEHLYFVISDPDPEENVLVVNLTTFNNKPYEDSSCILNKGDHPFIKRSSNIFYYKAQEYSLIKLTQMSFSGKIIFKETINDITLKRINRNHSYDDFKNAVRIIKTIDLKISVHMIIGLPGETPEIIKSGIKKLFRENEIDGIKFRMLEIFPGTKMQEDYDKNPDDFFKFDFDSYCILLADILETIPEKVVIIRMINFKSLQILSGCNKISKREVLEKIKFELKRRKSKQGSKV